ncbi:MAG: hypothetical protein ACHQ5A_10895, partial [Opitutales bacterium]
AILALGENNLPGLISQLHILTDSCNVSRWQLLPNPAAATRPFARDGRAVPDTLRLAAPEKMARFGLEGKTGAPRVTLTGPGGILVKADSDGITLYKNAIAVRQSSTGETLIEVKNAPAGTYTVQPDPSSAPVTLLEKSQGLPPPVIHAAVSGSGLKRTLHYSVSRESGLQVTFLEGVDGGAHFIGVAKGAGGAIPFTSALGSFRQRTIIAHLLLNGSSIGSMTVGTYKPSKVTPGTAVALSVRGARGRWTVGWKPGAYVTSQQLTLRFIDGSQVELSVPASARSYSIPKTVDRGLRPTAVEIVGIRGQTRGHPALVVASIKR